MHSIVRGLIALLLVASVGMPARAQPAPGGRAAGVPADGTYTYAITQGGRSAGTSALTIVHDGGGLTVRERAHVGAATIASDTIWDAATLRERTYALASGTVGIRVAVEVTTATMRVAGNTLPLRAPANAASILVCDGLVSSFALVPAYLRATDGAAFAFATTIQPHAVAVTVTPSTTARPPSAATGDVGTDLTYDGSTVTIWYDPATLTVDVVMVPAAALEYHLTGRTSNVAINTLASASQPTPVALPAARYSSRDVTFTSRDGARLAGTITIPDGGARPRPAVVLLHGSGALDRDETIGPNKIFLQIANALSNSGYVVLRYDKRGVGRSGGTLKRVTRDDFVDDAAAATAFVRRDPAVDPHRTYLLGHSEGAEIAPTVAMRDRAVRGIILLGAPAIPLDDVLIEQLTRGLTGATYDAEAARLRAHYDAIKRGDDTDPHAAWYRTSFSIDPAALIARVPCPILVLQGGKDIQVLAKHLPRLVGAARSAHRDIADEVFPDDNHLFMVVPGDARSTGQEYMQPGAVDPAMLDAVKRWLATH